MGARWTVYPPPFIWLTLLIAEHPLYAASIRSLFTDDTAINVIHTSMGHSTLLEFQSKPLSAVLGDHDAFKIEFVGNSITIKPLALRAKSNLFVFTEFERFNCQLITVPRDEVDYIVRISPKRRMPPAPHGEASDEPLPLLTTPFYRSAQHHGFKLTLVSQSRSADGVNSHAVTLLDFEVSADKTAYAIPSSAIAVKQSGKPITTQGLYLESSTLDPKGLPVRGKLALPAHAYDRKLPLTLIFRVPSSTKAGELYDLEVSTSVSRHGKKERR